MGIEGQIEKIEWNTIAVPGPYARIVVVSKLLSLRLL